MLTVSSPTIYTLGPEGTNCATAAQWWLDSRGANLAVSVTPYRIVLCSAGKADACVTTVVAADRHELNVLQDFGQVPMAFLLHSLKRADHA
jgi:hypothetical protein